MRSATRLGSSFPHSEIAAETGRDLDAMKVKLLAARRHSVCGQEDNGSLTSRSRRLAFSRRSRPGAFPGIANPTKIGEAPTEEYLWEILRGGRDELRDSPQRFSVDSMYVAQRKVACDKDNVYEYS